MVPLSCYVRLYPNTHAHTHLTFSQCEVCVLFSLNKQQISHFHSERVPTCGGGGGGEGVRVIFLSGGGEGVRSNVKIITCGGGEIECVD